MSFPDAEAPELVGDIVEPESAGRPTLAARGALERVTSLQQTGFVAAGLEHALPAVLTIEELAAFFRVNPKTLYTAAKAGEIPGIRRIGGVYRANRDAVLAWFKSGQGRDLGTRGRK